MKAIVSKTKHLVFLLFSALFLMPIAFFVSCNSGSANEITATVTAGTPSSLPQNDRHFDIDETLFIGDSNIYHLKTYGILPASQIITGKECYMTLEPSVYRKYIVFPGSDREMTLHDALSELRPEFIIITLGTDGAVSLDREGFYLAYTQLLDSVKDASPDTVIGVQSIFPVCEGQKNVRFASPDKTNQKFRLANQWLSEIAKEYGIVFFDTYSVLSDENGRLRAEFNTDHLDGYHLNRDGLNTMLEYIKNFVY